MDNQTVENKLYSLAGIDGLRFTRYRRPVVSKDGKEISIVCRTGGIDWEEDRFEDWKDCQQYSHFIDMTRDEYDDTYVLFTFRTPPDNIEEAKKIAEEYPGLTITFAERIYRMCQ